MPVLALHPAGTYEILPTRTYAATLDNVFEEKKEADMYHDQPYTQLCFHWLLDVPGSPEPATFRSWATLVATLNPKSTLFGVLSAMGLIQDGMLIEANTDNWIGLSCTIYIEKKTRADGSFTNGARAYSPPEPEVVAPPAPTFPRAAPRPIAPPRPVIKAPAPVVEDDLDLLDTTPF